MRLVGVGIASLALVVVARPVAAAVVPPVPPIIDFSLILSAAASGFESAGVNLVSVAARHIPLLMIVVGSQMILYGLAGGKPEKKPRRKRKPVQAVGSDPQIDALLRPLERSWRRGL